MNERGLTVSVALCTRNGARYLTDQLESILGQERPVDEIVVSDDASTDGTPALARRLLGSTSTVRSSVIVNSVALGVVENFQQAIAATSGDLIALADQDDVWNSDRMTHIGDFFAAHPDVDLVFTDARLIDEHGRALGYGLFRSLDVDTSTVDRLRSDPFVTLLRRNLATGATVVFRRGLFDRARPFPREWVHDEWLAIVAALDGAIDVIVQPTIDYRQHSSNVIGAPEPTIRRKIRRVLMPRGERNRRLARQFAVLSDRIEAGIGRDVDEVTRKRARDKARFEAIRAALPTTRSRRIFAVVALVLHGDYQRFASRGKADIVRDLVQPA